MKSRTLPEAEADLQRAIHWYEDRREGLGEEFLTAVLATIGPSNDPRTDFHVTKELACRATIDAPW